MPLTPQSGPPPTPDRLLLLSFPSMPDRSRPPLLPTPDQSLLLSFPLQSFLLSFPSKPDRSPPLLPFNVLNRSLLLSFPLQSFLLSFLSKPDRSPPLLPFNVLNRSLLLSFPSTPKIDWSSSQSLSPRHWLPIALILKSIASSRTRQCPKSIAPLLLPVAVALSPSLASHPPYGTSCVYGFMQYPC